MALFKGSQHRSIAHDDRRDGRQGAFRQRSRQPDDEQRQTVEKLLPQNVEAEAGVLGSLLIDPEAVVQVADFLRAEDFYRETHRVIFQAVVDLYQLGQPADLITLTDELQRRGKLEEIGGVSYVSSLANQVPTSANVEHYARIVERTSILRRLIHAAGQIAAVAYNEPDATTALDQAQRLIATVEASSSIKNDQLAGGISSTDLATRELPEPAWIVPGLLPEGLTLLAGREKMGKSWLAQGLGLAIAAAGMALGEIPVETQRDVLYLALEDNERRLKDRQTQLLMSEEGVEGLTYFLRWPRLDEGGLRWLARWLEAHPNTGAVFVDVLAEIRPRGEPGTSLYAEDRQSVAGLKELAAKHHVAIVLIHHLRKTPSADVLDEISASTGLMGAVDNVFVLKRERDRSDAVLHMTGRDIEQRQIALRFDDTRGTWTYEGEAGTYHATRERQEIAEVLGDVGPLKPHELVQELGREKGAGVRRLLRKMLAAGEIEQLPDGRYALRSSTSATGNSGNRVTAVTDHPRGGWPDSGWHNAHSAAPAADNGYAHQDASRVLLPVTAVTAVTAVTPPDDVCRFERHVEYWRQRPLDGGWFCLLCNPGYPRRE